MVGFKETSGKGEDWNVSSWKEMGSWRDKKRIKQGVRKKSLKCIKQWWTRYFGIKTIDESLENAL